MDLVLVLQASNDPEVGDVWDDAKSFAKNLVGYFRDISENGTHVGVITFAANPQVNIKLNSYKGAQMNTFKIQRDIDKLEKLGDKTYIEGALAEANTMFTEAAGMRKDVPKVSKPMSFGL